MASSKAPYISLARQLPPRLLNFFARFPPTTLGAAGSQTSNTVKSTTLNTSSSDPNAGLEEQSIDIAQSAPYLNPFQRTKHPRTGNWHDPVYSLRRQADLVKLARENGVEELLPPASKGTEERIREREEHGLRVKGTGVGQKVKGHWRERTLRYRLEDRRQAMVNMPGLVFDWKKSKRGRKWKKWPK